MNAQAHADLTEALLDEANDLLDRDGASWRAALLVARAWMHIKLAFAMRPVEKRLAAVRAALENRL